MAKQVSDSILLERYVSRREEAAFVDLVKRHGPRVQGTCRAPAPQRTRRRRRLPGDFSRPGAQGRRDTLAGIGGGLAVRGRSSAGDERPGRRLAASTPRNPIRHPGTGRRRPGGRGPAAGTSTIPWPTRSSRSNAGTCARSSTTNCSICPKSTGRRSSCATSRDEPTRRPPRSSAGRRARFSPAGAGAGAACAGDWSTAASSWRPAWSASALPHSWPTRPPHRDDRGAMTVRQLMISLKPLSEDGPGISNVRRHDSLREQSLRRSRPDHHPGPPGRPGRDRDRNTRPRQESRPVAKIRRRDARLSRSACPATQENNPLAMLRPPAGWMPVA